MATNVSDTAIFTTFSSTSTATSTVSTVKVLLLTLLISIISIIKLRKRAAHQKASKNLPLPPGPVPWPFVGNVPELLRNKPTFKWIHGLMKDINTDICRIRFANTNVIIVSDPAIAREMFKTQDSIFVDRPHTFSTYLITGGYLSTAFVPYGDYWKKMKKIMSAEIVSPARMKWLHDKRAEEADNLVFYIHNQYKSNKNVDLRLATQHYSTNVARKIIFGVRNFGKGMPDGGPGPEEIEHVDSLFKFLKHLYGFCVSDYMPFLVGADLDGQEKILKEANSAIRKYEDAIIDERVRQWKSGERKEIDDLLDVLITIKDSDGKPMLTPDQIRHQISEIMVATIDNPSNAAEWALAEMLNQPVLLQKATEEIDRVVGKDRLVQESDIGKLNYVKACAREAFRIHPTGAFNPPHVNIKDTTVCGYYIPKGSHVYLSRYGLGRNPKTWADPLKFDPERHLNEGEVVLTENDLRFVTFSVGKRACIGIMLGTYMTTILLARLIQCFTWTPPGNARSIDLTEAEDQLVLANPLTAFAKPRLAPHLYPTSS